ncbi:MAG TPA: hypothetical protein VEP89_05570 [Draconibacterium sp.]|nr:hypothetical protein [Draconibacterium sp.]
MKQFLMLTGILSLIIVLTSAISIIEAPQDPPVKKGTKHITMVKIGNDGKKVEVDTVITADQIFVWNGDTIGNGKELKWLSDEDFDMDFDFDITTDANGKIFMLNGKDDSNAKVYEYITEDGDSLKEISIKVITDGINSDIMKQHSNVNNKMLFGTAASPKVIRIDKQKSGNVIDLSDPGIISYDKKELRNGKEKIVIIREKPSEENVDVHEEIIIQGNHSAPMLLHKQIPGNATEIKVIKRDDDHKKIIEEEVE